MKLFKRIAVAFAALTVITSCSVLQGVAASASQTGSSTGSALAAIFNVLKSTGGIDLSNLANIINIGQILTGANSLTNATATYVNQFSSGLISGSSNLVNTSNLSAVLSGLKALSTIDTSAMTNAASKAYAGTDPHVTNNTAGVSSTMSALTTLLKSLE